MRARHKGQTGAIPRTGINWSIFRHREGEPPADFLWFSILQKRLDYSRVRYCVMLILEEVKMLYYKMLYETIDNLLQQIDDAFSCVECPSRNEVAEECHIWEFTPFWDEYNNTSPPLDWRDLTFDIPEARTQYLTFAKPKGFLYFFPAFLRCGLLEYKKSLEHTESCGNKLSGLFSDEYMLVRCIGTLVQQYEDLKYRPLKESNQSIRLFSQKQKKVATNFLVFARQRYAEENLLVESLRLAELIELIDGTLQDTRVYLNQ